MSASLKFCATFLGPRFSTEAVDEFHGCFMDAARAMRTGATVPDTAEGMVSRLITDALHLVIEHDRHESPFWRDLMLGIHARAVAA